MKRIWHPYTSWEDWKAGAWGSVDDKDAMLSRSIEFTGNAELYGSFMRRVIVEWPVTCEHHLTDDSINRRAWLGHAACCMAIGCPEDITRAAWGRLTEQQRIAADRQATDAIEEWLSRHEKENLQLHFEMEAAGIPE